MAVPRTYQRGWSNREENPKMELRVHACEAKYKGAMRAAHPVYIQNFLSEQYIFVDTCEEFKHKISEFNSWILKILALATYRTFASHVSVSSFV